MVVKHKLRIGKAMPNIPADFEKGEALSVLVAILFVVIIGVLVSLQSTIEKMLNLLSKVPTVTLTTTVKIIETITSVLTSTITATSVLYNTLTKLLLTTITVTRYTIERLPSVILKTVNHTVIKVVTSIYTLTTTQFLTIVNTEESPVLVFRTVTVTETVTYTPSSTVLRGSSSNNYVYVITPYTNMMLTIACFGKLDTLILGTNVITNKITLYSSATRTVRLEVSGADEFLPCDAYWVGTVNVGTPFTILVIGEGPFTMKIITTIIRTKGT